jgi:hypothetical protein
VRKQKNYAKFGNEVVYDLHTIKITNLVKPKTFCWPEYVTRMGDIGQETVRCRNGRKEERKKQLGRHKSRW